MREDHHPRLTNPLRRTAQVTLGCMIKARKSRMASPVSPTIESSRSPSEMAPLGPFVESEKAQMELYSTLAKTNSEETLEKEVLVTDILFLSGQIDVCSYLQAKAICIERPLLRSSHEDINFSRSFCMKISKNSSGEWTTI